MSKRLLRYNFNRFTNNKWFYYYAFHRLFYGTLIFRGNKALAFKLLSAIKYGLKRKVKCDPILVFLLVLLRLSPKVALFPIKKAGVIQGVPFPITRRGQLSYAVRFIIKMLKDKHRAVTVSKIVDLLVETLAKKGDAIECRNAIHLTAYRNKHLIRFYH